MRHLPVTLVAVYLVLNMTLFGQERASQFILPEIAEVGKGGLIRSELIFGLDDRPTPQCHASTIIETDQGLLAAWFAGTHEKHRDVGIWTSSNTDGTWSVPVEVADGVQNDTLRYPCWNPVLFQPQGGHLMLFYKVGPSPSEWWGMVKTSADHGHSWSDAQKLGHSQHGDLLGPIKNQPLQLSDGTIISPTSMEFETLENEDYWRVYFEISRDNGRTWRATDFINDGVEFDAIQPSILIHPEGMLQILCRTRQGVISQSWSGDGGVTWSKMTVTGLPNPNAGTDALTLKDGRHLLVYNHTTSGGDFPRGRNMLNLAISDDGLEWKPALTLEKQEGEYSYPTVIQDSQGLIHITYTYRRQSVKHAVVDVSQL